MARVGERWRSFRVAMTWPIQTGITIRNKYTNWGKSPCGGLYCSDALSCCSRNPVLILSKKTQCRNTSLRGQEGYCRIPPWRFVPVKEWVTAMTNWTNKDAGGEDAGNSEAIRKSRPIVTYQSLSMVEAAGNPCKSECDRTVVAVENSPVRRGNEHKTSHHFLQQTLLSFNA